MQHNSLETDVAPRRNPTPNMRPARRRLAVLAAATVAALGAAHTLAYPGGTRPTQMTTAVRSLSTSQMQVSGRITNLTGRGVAGMRIDVLVLWEAADSRWATTYTDGAGNYSVQCPKPPVGTSIALDVAGNGAYGRPLQVFTRP